VVIEGEINFTVKGQPTAACSRPGNSSTSPRGTIHRNENKSNLPTPHHRTPDHRQGQAAEQPGGMSGLSWPATG